MWQVFQAKKLLLIALCLYSLQLLHLDNTAFTFFGHRSSIMLSRCRCCQAKQLSRLPSAELLAITLLDIMITHFFSPNLQRKSIWTFFGGGGGGGGRRLWRHSGKADGETWPNYYNYPEGFLSRYNLHFFPLTVQHTAFLVTYTNRNTATNKTNYIRWYSFKIQHICCAPSRGTVLVIVLKSR